MHYSFYANEQDKKEIFDYIFNETDLKVFEYNTTLQRKVLKRFKSIEDILLFDSNALKNVGQLSIFNLWNERMGGTMDGLINQTEIITTVTISLGRIVEKEAISTSAITHTTKERSLGYKKAKEIGDVDEDGRNWKEIKAVNSKLRYHIHNKMAVAKFDKSNYSILKHAYQDLINETSELYPPGDQAKFIKGEYLNIKPK